MRTYQTSPKDLENIGKAYVAHPLNEEQLERLDTLRQQLSVVAASICVLCPPSRELSLALTRMEEASHWAQAAISQE